MGRQTALLIAQAPFAVPRAMVVPIRFFARVYRVAKPMGATFPAAVGEQRARKHGSRWPRNDCGADTIRAK